MPSVITLTSDFGQKGFYTAALKGSIFSHIKNDLRLVDISNDISPFNIEEAAYVIKNSYKHFPKGSIHIVAVDIERTPATKHILCLCNGHYFIAADNGVIPLILGEERQGSQFLEITTAPYEKKNSELFAKTAYLIANGNPLSEIGTVIMQIFELKTIAPVVHENQIKGTIVYIDQYGNGISNVPRSLFDKVREHRHSYAIKISSIEINTVYNFYSEFVDFSILSDMHTKIGEPIAIFNSEEFIEIAIYKGDNQSGGSASSLLGINYGTNIYINFYPAT